MTVFGLRQTRDRHVFWPWPPGQMQPTKQAKMRLVRWAVVRSETDPQRPLAVRPRAWCTLSTPGRVGAGGGWGYLVQGGGWGVGTGGARYPCRASLLPVGALVQASGRCSRRCSRSVTRGVTWRGHLASHLAGQLTRLTHSCIRGHCWHQEFTFLRSGSNGEMFMSS